MDLTTAILFIGGLLGLCIVTALVLAFAAVAFTAYRNLDDAYDDLHEEEDYLDDHKTKRQQR